MNLNQVHIKDCLLKRILLLYGIYSLLSNAFFLAGYYFLPEGFLHDLYEKQGRMETGCELLQKASYPAGMGKKRAFGTWFYDSPL